MLIVATRNRLYTIDSQTAEIVSDVPLEGEITAMTVLTTGIVLGSFDGRLTLRPWGDEPVSLPPDRFSITSMARNHTSDGFVYTAGSRIMSCEYRTISVLSRDNDSIRGAAVSVDDSIVVAVNDDAIVRMSRSADGVEDEDVIVTNEIVPIQATVSPRDGTIAFTSDELNIVNPRTLAITSFSPDDNALQASVDFSPDGSVIACGGTARSLVLIDSVLHDVITVLSPSMTTINDNGELWRTDDPRVPPELFNEPDPDWIPQDVLHPVHDAHIYYIVDYVRFSDNGEFVSVTAGGEVTFWNMDTQEPRAVVQLVGRPVGVEFAPQIVLL
jgi:hypothetical protein